MDPMALDRMMNVDVSCLLISPQLGCFQHLDLSPAAGTGVTHLFVNPLGRRIAALAWSLNLFNLLESL
jgi:hypothetical protein